MNETVLKTVSELIKQGVDLTDILKTLVRTRIDENYDKIKQYGYVVLTDNCKILSFESDEYIFFQGADVYKYDYLVNKLSKPDGINIVDVFATKYIDAMYGEFDSKIWKKHFASAFSIAEIERAEQMNFNVIVRDGDIEKFELDILKSRYKNVVTLESHKDVDYWLFEFANR